ncbi:hypothetical protein I4U23_020746 [Adineta vaga]|nr:hypothetical protein I4U23_020746 [Adineta vaga]
MIDHRLNSLKPNDSYIMDNDNDASMYIDPEILKKELVISLPILTESDIERMLNVDDDSTTEDSSTDEFDKDKFCPKRDQRRLNLLNDPNYGVILSFMDKFRSHINLKNYPLRIFEDNLISEHEKFSARYIDFHLTLLKKISSGKTIERDQFVPSMKRFAYRFSREDGDHLDEHGYAKTKVEIKLRILKNLLEKQFDRNTTMKNSLSNKASSDVSSKPFGRDRLGASYWLFMDTDCFIRLFREDIDANRTWINLAKNSQELENLLKILVTDYRVRQKFPDWKFACESLNSLTPSSVFEEHYSPDSFYMKTKQEVSNEHSPSSIRIGSTYIKNEHIDLDPVVSLDRELPSSASLLKSSKVTNFFDLSSDQESINSVEINVNRLSTSSSSMDTRDSIYSVGCLNELTNSHPTNEEIDKAINKIQMKNYKNDNTQVIVLKTALESGIQRKLVDYDDSERKVTMKVIKKNNVDLPIALRRPKRNRRAFVAELSPDSSSASQPNSQSSFTTRSMNKEWRNYCNSSRTNDRRQYSQRNRRRRRRGKGSMNGFSSTTSDDREPSDDDDDDDFAQDYLPGNTELDGLLNGELFEEEDDDDDDYIPCQTAKTVAKCCDQSEFSSKSCCACSQSDRPEILLLCETCDDAYHIECVKPELLAVPNDDWYCPLCEHKHLCDGLIEKLLTLIKDQEQFEVKRKVTASKRRKRLTNVAVNVERCIKPPVRKRQVNVISSSDDTEIDNDKETNQKKTNSNTIENDDVDSVYGCKNDENRKPKDQEEDKEEQTGKRRVRACRRKAQSYSLDEYNKKFEDALKNAGIHKDSMEDESGDSDKIVTKRKSTKKRARYELDEDFDASDSKHDANFVPSRRRTINNDSQSSVKENNDCDDYNDYTNDYNDGVMSDDDIAWGNRQRPTMSSISKTKSISKPERSNFQISPSISDDDTIIYGDTLSNSSPIETIKSEPVIQSDTNERNKNPFDINSIGQNVFSTNEIGPNLFDKNKFGKNVFGISEIGKNITEKTDAEKKKDAKPKRQRRAPPKKIKSLIQQENMSDEEENDPTPAPKHRPTKKRRDSNDSSLDDDDDYEKLAHKRRMVNQGRAITRKSITTHIKKLVGDEDEEEEKNENENDSSKDKTTDETKTDKNNNSKKANKNSQYDEIRLSDDDDFPDDQEILKTTGLINLKRPLTASQAASFRVPYMPTVQSYQFSMIDPTAHFDFTCQPEPSSDANQANGDTNLSTITTRNKVDISCLIIVHFLLLIFDLFSSVS